MPDGSALRRELPPLPRLVTTLAADKVPIDRETVAKWRRDRREMIKFRNQMEEDRGEQAEMAELIGQPAPEDLDAEWLTSRAEKLREKEREFAETLGPVIGALKSLLSPGRNLEPEIEELVRDSVQILEAYAPLYRDLSKWLMELAARRRTAPAELLRARPVKGKIDHEALSREIIARFPKILAALAR